MVGSVTLDGNGNIVSGEADASANGFYSTVPSITGTYSLDSTGHGTLAFSLNNTGCCGTFAQTHAITCVSTFSVGSVFAPADFRGRSVQRANDRRRRQHGSANRRSDFSAAQVSGGYSFTLIGFSAAAVKAAGGTGLNGSWGGVFTADGVGDDQRGHLRYEHCGRSAQLQLHSIHRNFYASRHQRPRHPHAHDERGDDLRLLHRDAGSFAIDLDQRIPWLCRQYRERVRTGLR